MESLSSVDGIELFYLSGLSSPPLAQGDRLIHSNHHVYEDLLCKRKLILILASVAWACVPSIYSSAVVRRLELEQFMVNPRLLTKLVPKQPTSLILTWANLDVFRYIAARQNWYMVVLFTSQLRVGALELWYIDSMNYYSGYLW